MPGIYSRRGSRRGRRNRVRPRGCHPLPFLVFVRLILKVINLLNDPQLNHL